MSLSKFSTAWIRYVSTLPPCKRIIIRTDEELSSSSESETGTSSTCHLELASISPSSRSVAPSTTTAPSDCSHNPMCGQVFGKDQAKSHDLASQIKFDIGTILPNARKSDNLASYARCLARLRSFLRMTSVSLNYDNQRENAVSSINGYFIEHRPALNILSASLSFPSHRSTVSTIVDFKFDDLGLELTLDMGHLLYPIMWTNAQLPYIPVFIGYEQKDCLLSSQEEDILDWLHQCHSWVQDRSWFRLIDATISQIRVYRRGAIAKPMHTCMYFLSGEAELEFDQVRNLVVDDVSRKKITEMKYVIVPRDQVDWKRTQSRIAKFIY